jgi:two-component system response regulator WspF
MRIAIVNDAAIALEAIRRVIRRDASHQIAWTATEGAEAARLCRIDTPDLILMDLFMPVMDGVEATRRIMAQSPCAILVVTASVTDNCAKAFEAMGAGALDVVNTPVLEWPGSRKSGSELLVKIESIRKLIGVDVHRDGGASSRVAVENGLSNGPLIAIGASAGGPAALARIISYLPANFQSPMVLVQHVDAQFAPALANWLDDQTPLRVRLAHDNDEPAAGTILLAAGDRHLVFVSQSMLGYSERPADCLYKPSIDVFFHSIEGHWPGAVVGVLLTGMGRDGAKGLLALRDRGHHTLAQDEGSSAVYGMPKAASALGAAAEILPLERIGMRLRSLGTQPIRAHV